MKLSTVAFSSFLFSLIGDQSALAAEVMNEDYDTNNTVLFLDDKRGTNSTQLNSLRGRQTQERIVGGEKSEPGEFPYYVDMGGCGGSLIAPNIVLSAAHCGDYTGQQVIVGGYEGGKTTYGAVKVKVVAQKMHPLYDGWTMTNDIMLLKLKSSVTPNNPNNITLSINDSKNLNAGEKLDVLGLGVTTEGGNFPRYLRDVRVAAVATSTCNKRAWYDGQVDDPTMFCAGVWGGGKDSCQGDSGGPIVRKIGNSHVQVGVVSWGEGCARVKKPGIYARVSKVHDWIKKVVCSTWKSTDASFCGDDDNGGGGGDNDCAADGKIEFDFTVRTDKYGSETSWILKNSTNHRVLRKRNLQSNKSYQTKKCIPKGTYRLILKDSYGDGLCCGGSNPGYKLVIDNQTIAEGDRVNFGKKKKFSF